MNMLYLSAVADYLAYYYITNIYVKHTTACTLEYAEIAISKEKLRYHMSFTHTCLYNNFLCELLKREIVDMTQ